VLPAGAGLVERGGKPGIVLHDPDPGLVPRLHQQALPLRAVGLGPPTIQPVHGHVGQLVAEDLFQETGPGVGRWKVPGSGIRAAIPQAGRQPDPPLDGAAEPQGHPHPGAELHRDRVQEARKAPGLFPAPDLFPEGLGDGVGFRHGVGPWRMRGRGSSLSLSTYGRAAARGKWSSRVWWKIGVRGDRGAVHAGAKRYGGAQEPAPGFQVTDEP